MAFKDQQNLSKVEILFYKSNSYFLELRTCLKVGGWGGGGGVKTQPGLKLDLLWSDSLRKFSQRSDCFSANI